MRGGVNALVDINCAPPGIDARRNVLFLIAVNSNADGIRPLGDIFGLGNAERDIAAACAALAVSSPLGCVIICVGYGWLFRLAAAANPIGELPAEADCSGV